MTVNVKPVGIALSGAHLAALLADPVLTGRLNESGLPFVVAGVDQVDPALPCSREGLVDGAVEPSAIAATLAAWAPDLGWLVVAALDQDHTYNLARRIASGGYLSGGRAGLVLGQRGRSALARYDSRGAGSWDGLASSLPSGAEATRGVAAAIRVLWQDWLAGPTVVGRELRTRAQGGRSSRLGQRGASGSDGPLTAPASPHGTPVLAWRAQSTGEAAAARRVADVLIWPVGQPDRLAAIAAASSGGQRLFLEVPVGGSDLSARLARHLADERVDGVILRPEGSETALREFITQVLPCLAGSGAFRTGWSGTLRERLSLRTQGPRAAAARTAFSALPPERALTREAIPVS